MIVSSYELLPPDKRFYKSFQKNPLPTQKSIIQQESINALKNKLQSVEENSSFYEIQIAKLMERLKTLEDQNIRRNAPEPLPKHTEDEEDWKELFYEENALKEKLENELDTTKQQLERMEKKLKESGENSMRWTILQKDNEAKLQSVNSMQQQLDQLKEELLASTEREKELEQLLISEITIREKYSILKEEYQVLQNQSEELKRRIEEISKKDEDMEVKHIFISELESKLAICEEDKSKLKASLLRIIESK
jgi:predicted  nucleic acid-binding Zn-ribbon protein